MSDAEQRIRLRGGISTSTGQVRENNEDNLHLWLQDRFVLAIVADGMGGAAAGEEASRLAVESVESGLIKPSSLHLDALTNDAVGDRMIDAIRSANNAIVDSAAANPEFRGMGTTATLAFVRGTHVIIAHVGDSRAYHIDGRSHHISQITADHSFVEALVAAGHLTHEQAEDHPMKNVLYRALGQTEEIDVDVYELSLHGGDRLVLCSDGLTRHIKADEIADIAIKGEEPTAIAQKLIDRANEMGGEDNVSAVVLVADSVEDEERTMELKMVSPLLSEDETIRLHSDDDTHPAIPVYRREDPPEGESRDPRTSPE